MDAHQSHPGVSADVTAALSAANDGRRRPARNAARVRRRRLATFPVVLVAFLAGFAAVGAVPASAAPPPASSCGGITMHAQSAGDVHGNYYLGGGARAYTVGVGSYLRRCPRGYALIEHHVFIDTRALPYGTPISLVVSTHRTDGKWARAHLDVPHVVKGHQQIDEYDFTQFRGLGGDGRLAIDQVHVNHCACAPGSGALLPWGSTAEARFGPWNGPEASPRR